MTRSTFLLIAWLALAAGDAAADDPSGAAMLRKLFPREADIHVESTGIARLPLPAEVLTACRSDLADVRIIDRSGNEVPFLVDSGLDPQTRVALEQSVDAPILAVQLEEVHRKSGPAVHRETYEINNPPAPTASETWTLAIKTSQLSFVRRVDVAAVAADGSVTPIAAAESLFRLPPSSQGSRERLALPLPATVAGRLRVTLEGEDGFYLKPEFRFTSVRVIPSAETLVVPLQTLSQHDQGGRSEIDLARPRGLVPDVVRVETSTLFFDRSLEVRDEGPGSFGTLLGETRLVRLETTTRIEQLDVSVRPAIGDRLQVRIANGDSPPLENLAVLAVVRQPSLIFSLPSTEPIAPSATLLFGGGRAHIPHYDVSGLLSRSARALSGDRAFATASLYNPGETHPATLGDSRANPLFEDAAVLAFAMRPGATVDPRLYTHRRSLAVTPSHDGLARLRLSAGEAAIARDDLADLRVIDARSAQWPYVLERNQERELVNLVVGEPTTRAGTSRYRFELPATPLRPGGIILETETPFIDRAFRLLADVEDPLRKDDVTIAQGRLTRRSPDTQALSIDFAPVRVRSLALVVEDGNEAALPLRARAELPVDDLLLAAPVGSYTLLLGNPEDAAPRYELAAIRSLVLALDSTPIPSAELAPNPDYSVQARLERGGSTTQTALLWTVLGTAVLVLGGITLRLARSEDTKRA